MLESIESKPSQDEIQAMLSGPDYFYCKREHCWMKKKQCIENQRQAEKRLNQAHFLAGDYITMKAADRACCWGCEQGEMIKAEVRDQRSEIRGQKLVSN